MTHTPTHRALDDVLTTVELLQRLLPYVRAKTEERRQVVAEFSPFFASTAGIFQNLRLMSHKQRPQEVLVQLLKELKIWDYFGQEPERKKNIEQLVSFFQEQDPKHLPPYDAFRSLVEYASLARNLDHIAKENSNLIVVPVHQSKGLEFDTVFIAGAVEGMMPIFRAKDL